MSAEDVVVTLVNQDSEDLVNFPEVHQVKLDEEEEGESASEGDIEIEHLVVGEDSQGQGENGGEDPNQVSNITFDVRKRTLIMLWQRTILEEYYRAGMTSASMQLHSLHQEAAEKTGLDNSVVKNWIRNRRRPAAIKSAERMVEKINQGELVAPYVPPTSFTSIGISHHPSPANSIVALAQSRTPTTGRSHISGLGPTDPKRLCLDQSGSVISSHRPFSSSSSPSFTPTQHSAHPTPSPSLHTTTIGMPVLIKVRISGSGEADFFEVELPSLSYDALLKACAEEVEVEVSDIAKVRKLPNILVRRDRDVQRLKEGQELELVLKEEGGALGGFCASSSGLSMLNLAPLVADPSSLGRSSTIGLHPTTHMNGLH